MSSSGVIVLPVAGSIITGGALIVVPAELEAVEVEAVVVGCKDGLGAVAAVLVVAAVAALGTLRLCACGG